MVHPVCSLHVLERVLHVMSYTPFMDLLVSLLCPYPPTSMDISHTPTASPLDQASDRASSNSFASTSQPNTSPQRVQSSPSPHNGAASAKADQSDAQQGLAAAAEAGGAGAEVGARQAQQDSPWQALFALHEHSLAYRECFLAVLHGSDGQLTCAAVRALVAVVHSKAVSQDVLSAAGQSQVRLHPYSL